MDDFRNDTEVVTIDRETAPIAERVKTLHITDELAAKYATDILAVIVRAKKRLEMRRKFFVDPLNQHVKNINNEYKCLIAPLEEMEEEVKGKLLGYRIQCRADADKKQEEVNRMAQGAGLPQIAILPVNNKVVSSMGSTFSTKRWTFEVTDITKVPREYLVLDEVKVNALIRSHTTNIKGESLCDLKVEGLNIYQKETISVKT